MNRIEVSYSLTVGDYRRANYYALGVRQAKTMRVLVILFGLGVMMAVSSSITGQGGQIALALLVGCFVWLLTLFAGVERDIRRYLKQPEHMIGCKYQVALESHRIEIRIPERRVAHNVKMKDLVAVFEENDQFLIYLTAQDAYILPFRCLSREQLEEVKETFRRHLGERFQENSKKGRKSRG